MGTETYPKKKRNAKHLQTGEQDTGSTLRSTDTLTKKDVMGEVYNNVYGPGTGSAPSGTRPEPKGTPKGPNIITAS
jgi:hypothetical protein